MMSREILSGVCPKTIGKNNKGQTTIYVIGGQITGLYDEQGNIKRGMSDAERAIYNNLITTTAIPISAPFAMSEFLPPEIWQAISILLRGAR